MSRARNSDLGRVLGARHKRYDSAAPYKATVVRSAIRAYLERQGEGWTVVVDATGSASEFVGEFEEPGAKPLSRQE
jgi:hypothetical protein